MSDSADNAIGARRCVSCGRVDTPIRRPPGPGGLAVGLWAAAGALWAIGFALGIVWLPYGAAIVFLGAFIYTLWYFFRREEACRHCGGGRFDPAGS